MGAPHAGWQRPSSRWKQGRQLSNHAEPRGSHLFRHQHRRKLWDRVPRQRILQQGNRSVSCRRIARVYIRRSILVRNPMALCYNHGHGCSLAREQPSLPDLPRTHSRPRGHRRTGLAPRRRGPSRQRGRRCDSTFDLHGRHLRLLR